MYLGKLKWEKIQGARETYLNGLPEGETRSANLNLSMLKEFLQAVEEYNNSGNQYIEDIDVVFLRRGLDKPDDWYEQLGNGELQMNLALVAKIGDEEALVLEPGGESTGLCPKNCGKL